MAKKLIPTDGHGNAVDQPKIGYKKKPDNWKESEASRNLRLNRERLFWKLYPEQREWIEDYVKSMKLEWIRQDKK